MIDPWMEPVPFNRLGEGEGVRRPRAAISGDSPWEIARISDVPTLIEAKLSVRGGDIGGELTLEPGDVVLEREGDPVARDPGQPLTLVHQDAIVRILLAPAATARILDRFCRPGLLMSLPLTLHLQLISDSVEQRTVSVRLEPFADALDIEKNLSVRVATEHDASGSAPIAFSHPTTASLTRGRFYELARFEARLGPRSPLIEGGDAIRSPITRSVVLELSFPEAPELAVQIARAVALSSSSFGGEPTPPQIDPIPGGARLDFGFAHASSLGAAMTGGGRPDGAQSLGLNRIFVDEEALETTIAELRGRSGGLAPGVPIHGRLTAHHSVAFRGVGVAETAEGGRSVGVRALEFTLDVDSGLVIRFRGREAPVTPPPADAGPADAVEAAFLLAPRRGGAAASGALTTVDEASFDFEVAARDPAAAQATIALWVDEANGPRHVPLTVVESPDGAAQARRPSRRCSAPMLAVFGDIADKADSRRVVVDLTAADGRILYRQPVRVAIDFARHGAFLCVDWGASSVAALAAYRTRDRLERVDLKLGLLRQKAMGGVDAERVGLRTLDPTDQNLIESSVGLNAEYRTSVWPTSLRDFSWTRVKPDTALRADADSAALEAKRRAAQRRLTALDRTYDVALPPRRADEGPIVDNLKLVLAAEARTTRVLGGGFFRRDPHSGALSEASDEVSVDRLIADCLDELVGLYLVEALQLEIDAGRQTERSDAHDWRDELFSSNMSLILTHPCGLRQTLIDRYRDAGRSALARMTRGLLPPLDLLGADASHDASERHSVVPVPESLAAAFWLLKQTQQQSALESGRLYAMDLGAGTFDVSVIDIEVRDPDDRRDSGAARILTDWSVAQHFGVAFGGRDLDDALARHVDALLELLADRNRGSIAVARRLADSRGSRNGADPHRIRTADMRVYASLLEDAKRGLTDALFQRHRRGEPWRWSRHFLENYDPSREPTLKILVAGGPDDADLVRILGDHPPGLPLPGVVAPNDGGEVAWLEIERAPVPNGGPDDYERRLYLHVRNYFDESARFAFEQFEAGPDADAVRRTLHAVVATCEFLSELLPYRAFERLAAQGGGGGRPHYCAVTGRAALFPPIFQGFRKFASRIDAVFAPYLEGPEAAAPSSPSDMKAAVMYGAFELAQSPGFLDVALPEAPLALVTRTLTRGEDGSVEESVASVVYLDDLPPGGRDVDLPAGVRIQLARAAPGAGPATIDDDPSREAIDLSRLPRRPVMVDGLWPAIPPSNLVDDLATPEVVHVRVERSPPTAGQAPRIERVILQAPNGPAYSYDVGDRGSLFGGR